MAQYYKNKTNVLFLITYFTRLIFKTVINPYNRIRATFSKSLSLLLRSKYFVGLYILGITWMLHQIIIYSDKVKLVTG